MSGERVRCASAQLPAKALSDDKVFTTPSAVLVLDGASAFRSVPVSASTYADQLGRHLAAQLTDTPDTDLRTALGEAIAQTTGDLKLRRGDSPSSTVAIVRVCADHVDGLVLGDSPIVFPHGQLADDRIDALDLPQRQQYRRRLASGTGYDQYHRRLLRELQDQQAQWRNRVGGYWIAEAEPEAANHALTISHPLETTPWSVLATDGAFNTIEHLNLNDWPRIARHGPRELEALLDYCRSWEANHDPHGHHLPRSKQHDDKAIAVARRS